MVQYTSGLFFSNGQEDQTKKNEKNQTEEILKKVGAIFVANKTTALKSI